MVDDAIGAGGWGYFRGPSQRPLADYARAFRFAEVNVTFYRHPALAAVRRWRRSVPPEFRFAVKVHSDVTHRARLRATREAMNALEHDIAVAQGLRSEILILQTPPNLRFDRAQVRGLRDLAHTLPPEMRIGLEARSCFGSPLPRSLAALLRDMKGIDVVDLSRGERPRVGSDLLYTRLFGMSDANVWEFSDDELRAIKDAAERHDVQRIVYTFHGVRMYKDAARFLAFHETGRFPPATDGRGIGALGEVLGPDAKFPMAREELLRDHGWKVLTLRDGRNVHSADILRTLRPGRYESTQAVVGAIADMMAEGPRARP